MAKDRLNVSLETHLRETLAAIQKITPAKLSDDLVPYVSSDEQPTTDVAVIPYDILQRVSKWTRTPEGMKVLQDCSPPLDPQSYSMVSLLAGSRTSPEKHFPLYVANDPLEESKRASETRKAVATVVNGALSVAGTGAATWWASEWTGLKLEWRALLAVATALIVAFSEIILYIIWDSRKGSKTRKLQKRGVAKGEKDGDNRADTVQVPVQATGTALYSGDDGLRLRVTNPANDVNG
ncbi:hypothetical protein BKA82DRAFT_135359 [Pisolithus tinctorius]|uniref:Uncharacterized protein n=1 Tax=Pisolithus tinctorius Marx 270 TaxID=870435 RepID=A0A0C3PH59_PISTI|nr:hypothetical protein BKA82DRAFT_135359 [Pisolithus tinctorius]KIO07776.1 hypothetical protein M404DRAFT_135359 [Pisolithus tinctorius Marx 270]